MPDWFDPFAEPRTIPGGWDLSNMLDEEARGSDDELKLPLPEQLVKFCLN